MSDAQVDRALAHCGRIQELLHHRRGGWTDSDALAEFRELTAAAARAAADTECAGMMRSADRYALDLYSESAHEAWTTTESRGLDFLRSQIFRLLDAFRDRLIHLHAVGS